MAECLIYNTHSRISIAAGCAQIRTTSTHLAGVVHDSLHLGHHKLLENSSGQVRCTLDVGDLTGIFDCHEARQRRRNIDLLKPSSSRTFVPQCAEPTIWLLTSEHSQWRADLASKCENRRDLLLPVRALQLLVKLRQRTLNC